MRRGLLGNVYSGNVYPERCVPNLFYRFGNNCARKPIFSILVCVSNSWPGIEELKFSYGETIKNIDDISHLYKVAHSFRVNKVGTV